MLFFFPAVAALENLLVHAAFLWISNSYTLTLSEILQPRPLDSSWCSPVFLPFLPMTQIVASNSNTKLAVVQQYGYASEDVGWFPSNRPSTGTWRFSNRSQIDTREPRPTTLPSGKSLICAMVHRPDNHVHRHRFEHPSSCIQDPIDQFRVSISTLR